MPITINGTGTVTGISAGGLPDGVITRPEMGYAGAVLQVVNGTYSVSTTVATLTLTDTGLSASITPTSATSKILVTVSQPINISRLNTSQNAAFALLRGATFIYNSGTPFFPLGLFVNSAASLQPTTVLSLQVLDSPATATSITYKTQGAPSSISDSGQAVFQPGSSTSVITLMEIAA